MRLPAPRDTSPTDVNLPTPNKMSQPGKCQVYHPKPKPPNQNTRFKTEFGLRILRRVPRYGEGLWAAKLPASGGWPSPWSALLSNIKTSLLNEHRNQTWNLVWQPPPISPAHRPISRWQPWTEQGERKVSKLPESRLPPSNIHEPYMTQTAQNI